eukprot:1156048-Pelagomonas_calceolata.AAC.7
MADGVTAVVSGARGDADSSALESTMRLSKEGEEHYRLHERQEMRSHSPWACAWLEYEQDNYFNVKLKHLVGI